MSASPAFRRMSDLIRQLDCDSPDFDAGLEALLQTRESRSPVLERSVAEILRRVRDEGDAGLLELTRSFDAPHVREMSELEVTRDAQARAFESLGASSREMLRTAATRIGEFHKATLRTGAIEHKDEFGNLMMREFIPLSRVGIYVPGGQASYPSTLLMTAIPARTAGVEEIVVTSPISEAVNDTMLLAAAYLANVDSFWRLGGAQAIAALAFGTEHIPRVDLIAGPGSARVTEAKRQVSGDVGIDLLAGPSEVLIVADEDAPPEWIALDLCAQAEHDRDAQAVLVSPSAELIAAVKSALESKLKDLKRADLIKASFKAHGALIRARSLDHALDIANRFAPEHLSLCVQQGRELLPRVKNAGAVFLGSLSSEVFGDYLAGPSHVLPTSGTARFASALGVERFVKARSVISLTAEGAAELAGPAARFAESEGLEAHAQAARIRER